MAIPNSAHKNIPYRSKWLAYLLLQAVESFHRAGLHDKAAEIMDADNAWVQHWKDQSYGGGLKNG
jgi:hypothetical protein